MAKGAAGLEPAAAPAGERETDPAGRGFGRAALERQRLIGRLTAVVWLPLVTSFMRFGLRWRIRDAARCRGAYASLLADPRPLLVVANHLTMVDSAVIGWGLASTAGHLRRLRGLPWNVPLQRRVESSWLWRTLAYAMKCVPIPRGGARQEVARVLERLAHLLRLGDAVLLFPEGGRSRSGRVDSALAADGVGRLIREVEGCRVLCVYARGDAQRSWSNLPARGEIFTIALRVVEPRTTLGGPRASRDLAMQVVGQLAEMEREYFAAHAP